MSNRNPIHSEILDKCKELHEKKSHDYAADDNPFSNFEYAARVSEIFTDPVDRVFATIIAIKFARLAELRKGKTPKNEPLEDTCVDKTNYVAIWASYIIGGLRGEKKKVHLTICQCEHAKEAHTPLENDGLGGCSLCKEFCAYYRSKYDHEGNLVTDGLNAICYCNHIDSDHDKFIGKCFNGRCNCPSFRKLNT